MYYADVLISILPIVLLSFNIFFKIAKVSYGSKLSLPNKSCFKSRLQTLPMGFSPVAINLYYFA